MYTVRSICTQSDGRQLVATVTFTLSRPYEKVIEYAVLVPNPANEVMWISYRLAVTFGDVKVRIYTVSGEHIYTGSVPGTMTSFKWDLRDSRGTRVAQGLYFVVLEAGDPWTGKRDRTMLKLAVR